RRTRLRRQSDPAAGHCRMEQRGNAPHGPAYAARRHLDRVRRRRHPAPGRRWAVIMTSYDAGFARYAEGAGLIDLVMPVYNEEAELPAVLSSLAHQVDGCGTPI